MATASPNVENLTDEEETNNGVLLQESSSTDGPMLAKLSRISKTRPFTNPVHRWFIDDSKNSKCTLCPVRVSGKNATNLEKHLQAHHRREHKKYLDEKRKLQQVAKTSTLTKRKHVFLASNQ